MEEDDLSWLDEEGDESSGIRIQSEDGSTEHAEVSPYAVKLDGWGKRKGKDLLKTREFRELGATHEEAADFFGMSFEFEPKLHEECADPDRLKFCQALEENPDFQALKTHTQLDDVASELAAYEYQKQLVEYRGKLQKDRKQNPPGDGPPSPGEQLRQDMMAMNAASKAAKGAAQEVKDLQDLQDAMGPGTGDGSGGKLDTKTVRENFKRMKNDPNLKRILELAGKYKMVARSKQQAKQIHGYDDLVGITMGNELSRAVSSELGKLAHPILRLDTMRRYVERQLMCREYEAVIKVGKGPIMVWIDESGSMSGERIAHAKAICLTMAYVAKMQKRWCAVVGWSSGNQLRPLALPPDKWPTGEVMDWLSGFINGGTRLPLAHIPKMYDKLGAQRGKTDIIIITDGDTEALGAKEMSDFAKWKKEYTAKLIGISIATPCRALKEASDEYHQISSLSVNNEAVGEMLSI